jgi:hypothetical protein
MRGPRYKFPDEVRSTTRSMASRMVSDATIVQTAQELDAWLATAPEEKESLERGGYNKEFTSSDLLPLLQVFIVQAGGPPPPDPTEVATLAAEPRRPVASIVMLLVILLAAVAVVILLAVTSD